MRNSRLCSLILVLLIGALAVAQETHDDASTPPSAHPPVANPARPTVSNPATLTPVGYVQFETGILAAWQSPDLVSQTSINEVIKYTASRWLELEVAAEPYAHSHAEGQPTNAPGDVDLGFQAVVHQGEGANPTVALSYFGRVYSGAAPDLDIASFSNSAFLLVSADVKGFHYDTNYIFNEVVDGSRAPRCLWADAFGLAFSFGQVRLIGRNLALHAAVSARQCGRKSVGGELQREEYSGARLRLRPRTDQHIHPVGSLRRVHLSAASQAAVALVGCCCRHISRGRSFLDDRAAHW